MLFSRYFETFATFTHIFFFFHLSCMWSLCVAYRPVTRLSSFIIKCDGGKIFENLITRLSVQLFNIPAMFGIYLFTKTRTKLEFLNFETLEKTLINYRLLKVFETQCFISTFQPAFSHLINEQFHGILSLNLSWRRGERGVSLGFQVGTFHV